MTQDSLTNPAPQFGTAEYADKPGSDLCKSCNQTIAGSYYRINGVLACPSCAQEAERQRPKDSHNAFVRGLLFGGCGALVGLTLYAAFGIITGWMIGYVSLAVGYIVGKAIKMGSRGIGGRRYQIAAVVLTYAAVSMAAVPIGLSQIAKDKRAQKTTQSQRAPSQQDAPEKPAMGIGAAFVVLALVGLASPFLELQDPVHGVIGLVILLVGIRIAWKLTAGSPMEILGPFTNPSPASARPDAG